MIACRCCFNDCFRQHGSLWNLLQTPIEIELPEISRFLGIVISMYFDDHNPPHFHVRYNSFRAVIDIRSLPRLALAG